MPVLKKILLALPGLLLAAGCASSGSSFDETKLTQLQAGVTTMDQATHLLAGYPAQAYRQSDGSTMALWSYGATFVSDGLYYRKEARLQFGADGRFVRLLETKNILLDPLQRQRLIGGGVP